MYIYLLWTSQKQNQKKNVRPIIAFGSCQQIRVLVVLVEQVDM